MPGRLHTGHAHRPRASRRPCRGARPAVLPTGEKLHRANLSGMRHVRVQACVLRLCRLTVLLALVSWLPAAAGSVSVTIGTATTDDALLPADGIVSVAVGAGAAAGTGYSTGAASITCSTPCTGSGFAGACTVTAGAVTAISVSSPGSGYDASAPPNITCPDGNADLVATATVGAPAITESTVCASSTHCYISANTLQTALASNNVTFAVDGAITIASAPTDGNAMASGNAVLTLGAGSSLSSLDHVKINADLNLGSQGTLNLINRASGGVSCIVGGSANTFGGAPTCTDTGGAGDCLAPGLFCLLSAELQRITAKNVYVSNSGSGAFFRLNGLSTSDTAGISSLLSLASNVDGYSGAANSQFLVKSAASEASCSLHLTANMGMKIEQPVKTTGSSDLLVEGDHDQATSGGLVLSTPVMLAGVPQDMLSAGQKLTVGAKSGGVSYSGAGHLKLSANSGMHITSSMAPTVTGLEIYIDADLDRTGEGTFAVSPTFTIGSGDKTRNIEIIAADINLHHGLDGSNRNTIAKIQNTGAYQIYVLSKNSKKVGLGKDLSAEGGMSISGNEVYGFISKTVNIGGADHGGLVVASVTETQSMNSERFILSATSSTHGTVTFQDYPSSFRVLDVIAYKGITVNVSSSEGVKTTYFTGTMTFTVTGTVAQGGFGIVLAKGTYLNCATKLTIKSASGATADTLLYLNGASGIQIDTDLNVTSTNEDIEVVINCDTDLGGTGPFILCGSTADTLLGASTLCSTGVADRKIYLMPDPGKNAHLTIKSMKMALGGDVWTGPTGSVTLYPTSNVKAAVGDKANVLWTLTQVEYDRITAGDTLTIGSNELEKLWVSGIQTTRDGKTVFIASKAGASVVMHKEYNSAGDSYSNDLQFGGALTLIGGDGVFVNDSLTIGGALVVDANADNAGGDSFYCIDGNQKYSCSTDADCARPLCSDGITFCDGGQIDCTGSVCNVPTSWGSCVSKGEFRLTNNVSIATGGADIKADTIVLKPQRFPWHTRAVGYNESIGGHMHAQNGGAISLQPKTTRGVRLGYHHASITHWRGTDLLSSYGTTFGVDQRTLDSIHTTGSLTIGGAKTSSITVTGLTWMRSLTASVTLTATQSTSGGIALMNSSECSVIPEETKWITPGNALVSQSCAGCDMRQLGGCLVNVLGPLYITSAGSCDFLVDITVFLITTACSGATVQTGTLIIEGQGVDLEYVAVGDVIISGNVINKDRMTFRATGNVSISADMTCAGLMTIVADSDNDGAGTFKLATGKKLTSTNFPITITANDIELGAGSAGTSINAGNKDITIVLSDAAEIGLNAAASGMQISADELATFLCRNLSIGGINSHIRIGTIPAGSLDAIRGFVTIRASAGDAFVGVEGAVNLSMPALDLEVAGNITLYCSVFTTAVRTLGPITDGPTIVAALRLAALGITLSNGISLSSAGDLFLGHYSGQNGASPWGSRGIPRIGDVHMTTPTGFRAGRHLILLSNIKTSGAGLLELIADNDSNLDGTVQLSAMVQVFGASGTGSGTVFISGDDVKVSLGALIHLDQGDLLVTATDFRFGSAPECSRGASLSMELVNQLTNQHFVTKSSSAPGAVFFEPVPTTISSIGGIPLNKHVTVLNRATGERGGGRGRFAPGGGDIISVSGSAFGPEGSDAKFSAKVGSRFCALSGGMSDRELVPPSGIFYDVSKGGTGAQGERIRISNVQEYKWHLLNGTLIKRYSYSFSLSCALPPGTGESLDFLFVAGWCGGMYREPSLLGYSGPRITSIVPASVPVSGTEGGGVKLTILGSAFGVEAPAGGACRNAQARVGQGLCENGAKGDMFAVYLRDMSVEGGGGNMQACTTVDWTSDSSVSCSLQSVPRIQSANAVVVIHGQSGVGGNLSIVGSASFVSGGSVNCHGFVASMSNS